MKFVSKNGRLRLVLKHGIPPEPITGRQAVPGLYVKFEDGVVNINDKGIIEEMRKHSGYGKDFVEVGESVVDPFKNVRAESEPRHTIQDINYGHLGKGVSSPNTVQSFPSEQKEVMIKMASEMAKSMVKDILKEIGVAKKMGRPKKIKEEIINEVKDSSVIVEEAKK